MISDLLLNVIHTGLTPQRQHYRYPKNLTKTEPHETLLERFRATHKHSDPELANMEQDLVATESLGGSLEARLL